jgi:tripartite-type tricarboxylate transporter receptor subunit TctC
MTSWYGIGVPRGVPADIVDKLTTRSTQALADADMTERFGELGGTVFAVSPADFGDHVARETEKWGKVVKFAGVRIT